MLGVGITGRRPVGQHKGWSISIGYPVLSPCDPSKKVTMNAQNALNWKLCDICSLYEFQTQTPVDVSGYAGGSKCLSLLVPRYPVRHTSVARKGKMPTFKGRTILPGQVSRRENVGWKFGDTCSFYNLEKLAPVRCKA